MTRDEWRSRISDIGFGLWIGEVCVRHFSQWLREIGIDTIVSIMSKGQHEQYDGIYPVHTSFVHRRFYADDNSVLTVAQLSEIVSACGKTTLVHCVSGSNRSTAVALCYLMARVGLSPIVAANRYYPARSMQMQLTYHTVPRMTFTMENNVTQFAACVNTASSQ